MAGDQAANEGHLADVLGAVVDDADQSYAGGDWWVPVGVDHPIEISMLTWFRYSSER